MLEKLYAHGLNWQLGIFMLLSFFIMKIKTVGNLFKSINTLYHECGHAIAALITNGEIYHIKLNSNTSGEALTSTKGWFAKVLVAISGYLFPLVICLVIICLNKYYNQKYSNYALLTISLTASIMWIRNSFGYIWSLGYIIVGILPFFLHQHYFLKTWLMLNVSCIIIENVTASFYLLKLSIKSPKQAGDASTLQQATFVPAVIWSLFFLIVSSIFMVLVLFAEQSLKFKIY
jgi:hypothetical protein